MSVPEKVEKRIESILIGNRLFAIYLLYAVFVIGTEWVNFFTTELGLTFRLGRAELISGAIVFCLLWINRKKFKVYFMFLLTK